VWIRDEQILAVGMVDDNTTGLIRMGIAPSVDTAFAAQMLADLSDSEQHGSGLC
jgi:hypothetical protein